MTRFASLLAAAALTALPALAWGNQGHRLAASFALKDLPPDVALWFRSLEATLPDHASDPDIWKGQDPTERPHHYLNCEPYGGPAAVPLDENDARNALGPDLFRQSGQVTWTILARVHDLTEAFSAGDPYQVAYRSSILCHYVADLQVPLHTTTNHDGKETGQRGVHHRWEEGLVKRLVDRDGWEPEIRPASLGADPAGAPWAWLRESYALVAGVLRDDLSASSSAPQVDAADAPYWTAFMQLQGPHVKEQLTLAAQRTARMILFAWDQAGRPQPPAARTSAHPSR
ncbi:phospholipase C/P1 nuclease family protein [Mesoterricola silvestris]|uniref:S1/P1 Nuclease n=1 Tax=Mesoterricola silvestris TaxID=2927979 RepID=A0AA48GP92_9BACT|nr:S1/P1 nuclease [Mesoterricola silvestris]BDU75024.1 hypothetical protein METEAL_41980 [Mesoterricola silvestris]